MSDDKDIRDLFTRARQADRSETPPFEPVRRTGQPARAGRRRLFTAAALGSLAAGALLVFATVTVMRAPEPIAPIESAGLEDAGRMPPSPVHSPPPAPTSQPSQQIPPERADSGTHKMPVRQEEKAKEPVRPIQTSPAPMPSSPVEQTIQEETESTALGGAPGSVMGGVVGGVVGGVMGDAPSPKKDRSASSMDAEGVGKPNVHGARDTGLSTGLDGRKVTDSVPGRFAQSPAPALRRAAAEGLAVREFIISNEEMERLRALGHFAPEAAVPPFNTESYSPLTENPFLRVNDNPVSTFSVDVDTASYSMVRRFLDGGALPPPDAVRLEEMINYFPYHDAPPRGTEPFSVHAEVASCPWEPSHRLARIALRGREVAREEMAGSNLVFLVDVSGSMDEPNKLPLVQSSLAKLTAQLDGRDEVAIVVYAGSSGLVLPPTRGSAKREILEAIEHLRAGGSTNGGEGLRLAYATARRRLIEGGVNRVILATDGDFNVGITDRGELIRFVEEQAKAGVFLTVLGFGMGNYKDDRLEQLADKGNGNYAYIDSPREAQKALVEQIGGTLITIAKDVKIQVEFNPAEVAAYRLIGYENRLLRREDFNDDRKDAGEIGSGHTVTALYEVVPRGETVKIPSVDPLKYQSVPEDTRATASGEAFTVKLRYKDPDGERSRLIEVPVTDDGPDIRQASDDLRFAAAVASFGMILRHSANRGSADYDLVLSLTRDALGDDAGGHRHEFVRLVRRAAALN